MRLRRDEPAPGRLRQLSASPRWPPRRRSVWASAGLPIRPTVRDWDGSMRHRARRRPQRTLPGIWAAMTISMPPPATGASWSGASAGASSRKRKIMPQLKPRHERAPGHPYPRRHAESAASPSRACCSPISCARSARHQFAVHVGCEHGVCGACTVRVDGRAVRSCLTFAVQADGLRRSRPRPGWPTRTASSTTLQKAFRKNHHALQCGYCTPGILMSVTELPRASQPGRQRGGAEGHAERAFVPLHRLCRHDACNPRNRHQTARPRRQRRGLTTGYAAATGGGMR